MDKLPIDLDKEKIDLFCKKYHIASIDTHAWAITNCTVVHFSVGAEGSWTASKLT